MCRKTALIRSLLLCTGEKTRASALQQEALHPPSRFQRRPHRSGGAQGAGSDVSGGSSMSMEGDACSSDCESPVQPLGSGQDQRSWAWQQQTRVLRSASRTLGLNT